MVVSRKVAAESPGDVQHLCAGQIGLHLSPPPTPRQPRGQRKYACDKKGRGNRKKADFGEYVGRASKN